MLVLRFKLKLITGALLDFWPYFMVPKHVLNVIFLFLMELSSEITTFILC